MPVYREGDDPTKTERDLLKVQKEHHEMIAKAREIFQQNLPPFLALAMVCRMGMDREEAKKLQNVILKNSSSKQ